MTKSAYSRSNGKISDQSFRAKWLIYDSATKVELITKLQNAEIEYEILGTSQRYDQRKKRDLDTSMISSDNILKTYYSLRKVTFTTPFSILKIYSHFFKFFLFVIQIYQWINITTKKYSDIVKQVEIGKSLNNNNIIALKVFKISLEAKIYLQYLIYFIYNILFYLKWLNQDWLSTKKSTAKETFLV